MFSHHLNFSPDIINTCKEKDWSDSQSGLVAKERLSRISLHNGGSVPPVELITEETVVKTLRSPERPETIYWLLRYFVEANGENPVINTDRAKTIYVEFDRIEDSISVYVGATQNVLCVGEKDGNKIYAMEIQERYDFLWYPFLGAALKRQMSAQAIREQADREDGNNKSSAPILFYTTGKDSACILRTDWYQSRTRQQMQEAPCQTHLTSFEEYKNSLSGTDKSKESPNHRVRKAS